MFLLAQASDLIYLFLLMFLSEHVFEVSKEIQKWNNISISFDKNFIFIFLYK